MCKLLVSAFTKVNAVYVTGSRRHQLPVVENKTYTVQVLPRCDRIRTIHCCHKMHVANSTKFYSTRYFLPRTVRYSGR